MSALLLFPPILGQSGTVPASQQSEMIPAEWIRSGVGIEQFHEMNRTREDPTQPEFLFIAYDPSVTEIAGNKSQTRREITKKFRPVSVGADFLSKPTAHEGARFYPIVPPILVRSIEPDGFNIASQGISIESPPAGLVGQIQEIERTYVIDDRPSVLSFIERNHFQGLLLEAIDPLRTAFGNMGNIRTLRLIRDDEGIDTLFCMVQFKGEVEAGMQALASFDEQWWLARSRSCEGKLNFDFEFV